MSAEQNKDIFRRVIEEGFNNGNLDALNDCFPPTYTEHQFDLPPTLEEFKGSIRFLRDTFSPFSLTIEDMIADGDKVWARMTGRGTDSKGIMGRPPTGRSFAITVFDVGRRKAVIQRIEIALIEAFLDDAAEDFLVLFT